jgi:GGDEF domain-containing protein
MNTTQRLSSIVRRNEMVARLGGDEFAIILGEIRDDNTIEPLCIRIVQELRAPILYNLHTIEITPSLGVALYPK